MGLLRWLKTTEQALQRVPNVTLATLHQGDVPQHRLNVVYQAKQGQLSYFVLICRKGESCKYFEVMVITT